MLGSKFNEKENAINITINSLMYPLEAIYGASYVFLDKTYIFLDGDPKKQITVTLKGKEKLTKRGLENLAGEFYNELLNCSLRNEISKNNQKIRESIVAAAFFTTSQKNKIPSPGNQNMQVKREWQEDKLGLALPWEEKYGEKKRKRK